MGTSSAVPNARKCKFAACSSSCFCKECTVCTFLSKDGEHGFECGKVQCRHLPNELFRQEEGLASSTITFSIKRTLSTEPCSSITVVSTLERAFNLDTCRKCVSERHQSRNKTCWKSTSTEQMAPFPALQLVTLRHLSAYQSISAGTADTYVDS